MKILKRIVLLLLIAALIYGVRYAWVSFPIMSGFTAKNMCSCVFVAGRDPKSVETEELGDFPLSLAGYIIDSGNRSVTSTVFGMAKKKAIYREGFGCTLVNELSEDAIKKQTAPVVLKAPLQKDSAQWPAGNKAAEYIPANIDYARLAKTCKQEVLKTNAKSQHETRALLVVYDGRLITENYAPGFNKNSKMLGWSMAKSITSAMIGMLVKQNKLDVLKPAPVAEWTDAKDGRHSITLETLLQQTSGLNFEENYNKSSNATVMLFNKADMGKYTALQPLKEKPGTQFYYSSGNSNILSRIVRQTVGDKNYHFFIYDSLFYKLGMYNTVMEPDASGTMVGSSYVFATAQDWARFGLLYYNNGVVNGQKLFTDDWVTKTAAPSTADKLKQYGYQFWLNGFDEKTASKRKFSAAPADMFYADGYAGQYVFIIPSKKIIIVRLGFKNFDENELLRKILQCVK
ncbi:MAG: class C beta-lactamase-related serine hydrolase [Sphingobacteriales bacterium]|nr:MAG: class C beta-lactamase-related serine hydrolase [Sphingobacteriales bacterium]